ncbi:MAG: TetR/AcrR family transcriptional regulator [Bacteroidales bacterium]|nr:TetR/AcrR family transcriptional regulator [Bacteroidales bacterium]
MIVEKREDIIDAAGSIILQSGINALSIEELELKMGISHQELSSYFSKDNDIHILLLNHLEHEIQQLIKNVATSNLSPDEELQNLFKSLNKLFDQKPFYLVLIFARDLAEKDSEIPLILNRIIKRAENFLLHVINKGKQENIFQAGTKSRYLVNRILVSFRLLMNEQRVTETLVRDIALLKSKSNAD